VHRILSNEAYTGRTYFNKYVRTSKTIRRLRPRNEWTAIAVPAIIDRATFDAAQRQLVRNRDLSPRNKKRKYLLAGHLRCGRCGRGMTGGAYPTVAGMTRTYRCSSMNHIMDPEGRCYGQLKADDVEPQAWAAVVNVLEHPDLITAEVQRQESTAEDQRAEVDHELVTLDAALAKCDREAQRWSEAYAAEVIDIRELKAYRAEIDAKRQSLLTQQAVCQAKLEAIGQEVAQVGSLIDYCARVRQRLQTFDTAEKRLAFRALDIRVTWTPGQALPIEGTIPLTDIVPIAS
jgi:site-specific DNA recombinase